MIGSVLTVSKYVGTVCEKDPPVNFGTARMQATKACTADLVNLKQIEEAIFTKALADF